MKHRLILILILVFSQTWFVRAQNIRETSTLYGIGNVSLKNIYLSPLSYSGISGKFFKETMHHGVWHNDLLVIQNIRHVDLGYTHNKVENNNTLYIDALWGKNVLYRYDFNEQLKLYFGGGLDINGGLMYNLRNGNNPVAVSLNSNVNMSAVAEWTVHISDYPVKIKGQMNIPLVGVAFSPKYGQSYYELFTLDNGSGSVKFTSIHNNVTARYMLSAFLPIGKAALQLGYAGNIVQTQLNDIESTVYNHSFVIGYAKKIQLISYKKKKTDGKAVRYY